MSPPNVAPPPPPPPPPVDESGLGAVQLQPHPHQILPKVLANGELQLCQPNGGSHIVSAKKIQAPFHDPRNDLMKAIRDGNKIVLTVLMTLI